MPPLAARWGLASIPGAFLEKPHSVSLPAPPRGSRVCVCPGCVTAAAGHSWNRGHACVHSHGRTVCGSQVITGGESGNQVHVQGSGVSICFSGSLSHLKHQVAG